MLITAQMIVAHDNVHITVFNGIEYLCHKDTGFAQHDCKSIVLRIIQTSMSVNDMFHHIQPSTFDIYVESLSIKCDILVRLTNVAKKLWTVIPL